MNRKSVLSTIFTVAAIYLLFDIVFWKGFLYHFLEAFFKSMAQQGKVGLVIALIGLAVAVFGLIAFTMGMLGKNFVGAVPPERRTTHKILMGTIGGFLAAIGLWLAYYGFTLNR